MKKEKNYVWKFSIWRPRQQIMFGIEWVRDGWHLEDFDVYLGFFAFGWIRMPKEFDHA